MWFTAPAFEPGTSVDSYPEDGRGVAVVRPAEETKLGRMLTEETLVPSTPAPPVRRNVCLPCAFRPAASMAAAISCKGAKVRPHLGSRHEPANPDDRAGDSSEQGYVVRNFAAAPCASVNDLLCEPHRTSAPPSGPPPQSPRDRTGPSTERRLPRWIAPRGARIAAPPGGPHRRSGAGPAS